MTQTFEPDPGNPRAFRDALGRFATGVCVITVAAPEGPMGFTANSFSALSLDPPLVLWSPARASTRYPALVAAAHFSVHVLARDQYAIDRRFVRGGQGFAGMVPELSPWGVPLIPGCLARVDCAREALHEGGDHTIVVGRVLRAMLAEGEPLVFSSGRYGGFVP